MRLYLIILSVLFALLSFTHMDAQTADDIIQKADEKYRGKSAYTEMTIQTVRPKWSKEMKMKGWSKGSDYSVSLVLSPAKEKGVVFLMREKEVWNYIPSLNRSIKFPPSMMMQNWMGTDLTNDDLVKQSSMIDDYDKQILGSELREGLDCWKIELIPHEDVAVVWGKIIIWVEKNDYMQLQTDFYDEDGFLVNQMIASDIQNFDGKRLPSTLKVVPADKENQYTLIHYDVWNFDVTIPDTYFTTNYMKRIR